VIVLLDSDAQPEPGWLQALLAPFQLADTICVNGYTYLGHSDFISRTLALIWVFPSGTTAQERSNGEP
jgi:cellulose synthase/poly-beta-1,6-N-acetylglucosamine synthase-like glycosyltransferase